MTTHEEWGEINQESPGEMDLYTEEEKQSMATTLENALEIHYAARFMFTTAPTNFFYDDKPISPRKTNADLSHIFTHAAGLFRNTIKRSEPEMTILMDRIEKSLYHNYKMNFKDDPIGKSKVFFDGVPIIPKSEKINLNAVFLGAVIMFYRNLNDKVRNDDHRQQGFLIT